MTDAEGQGSQQLRVGGWLPPVELGTAPADDVTAPDLAAPPRDTFPRAPNPIPPLSRADSAGHRQGHESAASVRAATPWPSEAAWMPPIEELPLGERPTRRRTIAGPTGPGRARVFLVIAVAAAVPLAFGMIGSPTSQDRSGTPMLPTHGTPEGTYTYPPAVTVTATAGSPGSPPGPATQGVSGAPTSSAATVAKAPPPADGPPDAQGGANPSLSLEAEGRAADWSGPTRERELAGASGGVVVGSSDQGLVGLLLYRGASVVFKEVTVPEAGRHTITFYYATPESRQAVVSVNGRGQTSLRLPATGDGGTAIGALSIPAQLTAGSNTVEFGNQDAPIPDLDRIVVDR